MVQIYIPQKSEALNEEFFARHAEEVAKDLLGRTLVRERPNKATLYAVINEVSAWEGDKEKSMTKGALYAPGTLLVSTKFGNHMLDISTYKIGELSCITLIAASIGDERGVRESAQGPGKLTKALEIEKDSFNGLPLRLSQYLWFGGPAASPDRIAQRSISKAPKNCRGYFYLK
jgi:3-methyladenine DNA glycosylase Mpg